MDDDHIGKTADDVEDEPEDTVNEGICSAYCGRLLHYRKSEADSRAESEKIVKVLVIQYAYRGISYTENNGKIHREALLITAEDVYQDDLDDGKNARPRARKLVGNGKSEHHESVTYKVTDKDKHHISALQGHNGDYSGQYAYDKREIFHYNGPRTCKKPQKSHFYYFYTLLRFMREFYHTIFSLSIYFQSFSAFAIDFYDYFLYNVYV